MIPPRDSWRSDSETLKKLTCGQGPHMCGGQLRLGFGPLDAPRSRWTAKGRAIHGNWRLADQSPLSRLREAYCHGGFSEDQSARCRLSTEVPPACRPEISQLPGNGVHIKPAQAAQAFTGR